MQGIVLKQSCDDVRQGCASVLRVAFPGGEYTCDKPEQAPADLLGFGRGQITLKTDRRKYLPAAINSVGFTGEARASRPQ